MKLPFGKISGSKNIFLYSTLLVLLVFIITRVQYFLYYPVLVLSSDSASYCAAAFDIMDFHSPVFDIRTPGYPLILSLVWMLSKTVYVLALAQSLFTLAVSIFFLWVIDQIYRSLTFLSAISLSVFISSSYYLILEVSLLTEGIFVSTLLLSSGLLMLALKKNQICCWALYSASVALIILIRPAGLFLIGVMAVIFIFFWLNKYKFKFYLSLVLPFAAIIFSLCMYNYMTLRLFTITPFGEANLSGVTLLFMEPSPEYPQLVNDAIKNTLDSVPRSDINYVRNSSGISKLYYTFNDNFYRQVSLTENLMKADSALNFVAIQPIIRKISIDAIKNNPKIYAKFVMSNFLFFFYNVKVDMNYYEELSGILQKTYVEKKYIRELETGKWRQISSDKTDNEKIRLFFTEETLKQNDLEYVEISEAGGIELKPTFLKSLYEGYESVYNFLFRNFLWLILFGAVFIISIIKLIKSRFRDVDAFIPFLFCIIYITKAILVSLVEVSLTRYSFTVEYAVYFSLPFLVLLLKSKTKMLITKNL
ncbi:MAG: hypothetical protein M3P82_00800 [Bacteroidota bacterium]|nr:hypothetical protein [Bacteroidota bacterium]